MNSATSRDSIWYYVPFIVYGLSIVLVLAGGADNCFCERVDIEAVNDGDGGVWHGLWHVFAGIMAVFVYYHWRRVRPV